MPLFGRRRRVPEVRGPDGTEYVEVDAHTAQDMAVMLAERTTESMNAPIEVWAWMLMQDTYIYIVAGVRGEPLALTDATQAAASHTLGATELGWELHGAEFAFLDQDPVNPVAADLLAHLHDAREQRWEDAVGLAASTMMNASRSDPDNPEHAPYLQPVGCGHALRAQTFRLLVASLLGTDRSGSGLREVPGVSADELDYAARYGYYLRACAVALPPPARAELGTETTAV